MTERVDYLKIRDIIGPRGVRALKELCIPAGYLWREDYRKLQYTANCIPRTFDFPTGGTMEESVLRSIFQETHFDVGAIMDRGGESAQMWINFIREMGEDIEFYIDGVHRGISTRNINGVQQRLSWKGVYKVLIVTFDITSLGAQVAGYPDGVIHQHRDCIRS